MGELERFGTRRHFAGEKVLHQAALICWYLAIVHPARRMNQQSGAQPGGGKVTRTQSL